MRFFLVCISVLFALSLASGQSPKDSILMAERSIDRPLTLHKGQIRIEAGYAFSSVTRRFDTDGEVVKLFEEEGYTFVRQAFLVDLRYGILENLSFTIASTYKAQTERHEEVYVSSTDGQLAQLFEIRSKKGIEDLFVGLTARAPFTSRKVDLIIQGGLYVPVGAKEDSRPDHSVEQIEGGRKFTYRYGSFWGYSDLAASFGGGIKYRTKAYAFTALVSYDYPLGESKNLQWTYQLVDDNFEYKSDPYAYQVPANLKFNLEIERQITPWFDLSLLFHGEQSNGGWEEINGQRYSIATIQLYSINPGYEIIVTPKLWLRQRVSIPLWGENSESPFSIYTSLVYNFFPFK